MDEHIEDGTQDVKDGDDDTLPKHLFAHNPALELNHSSKKISADHREMASMETPLVIVAAASVDEPSTTVGASSNMSLNVAVPSAAEIPINVESIKVSLAEVASTDVTATVMTATNATATDVAPINRLPFVVMRKIFDYLTIKEKVVMVSVSEHWRQMSSLSWIPNDVAPINCLPIAVVLKIFDHLTMTQRVAIESVSKDWREMSHFSWSSLTEFVLPQNFRRHHHTFIKLLNRTRDWRTNESNLKKCSMRRSPISDEDIRPIIDCPQLERLDLRENTRIYGNFLKHANANLVSLNLAGCTQLKDESLESLADKCPLIEELKLSGCHKLTTHGFLQIAKLKALKVLIMMRLRLRSTPFSRSVSLSSIFIDKVKLVRLNLSNSSGIDRNTIHTITNYCHNLESLDLASSDAEDISLVHFSILHRIKVLNLNGMNVGPFFFSLEGFRNLEELYIGRSGVTDVYLLRIVGLPSLKILGLDGNLRITGRVFHDLASMPNVPQHRTIFSVRQKVPLKIYCDRTGIRREDVKSFQGEESPFEFLCNTSWKEREKNDDDDD